MIEKEKLDAIDNSTSWKKDQAVIKEILVTLNGHFGPGPIASGLEYLNSFDSELTKAETKLYATTKSKLVRIRTDAESWMKTIYQSKWMHAEDYITKTINYTTYLYTL